MIELLIGIAAARTISISRTAGLCGGLACRLRELRWIMLRKLIPYGTSRKGLLRCRPAAVRVTLLHLALIVFCAAFPALAQPGSGTADISPADDVTAGSAGTWTVQYVATERFDSGTLELVIPAGWSLPQRADDAAEGYVTVTSSGWLAAVPLTIVGTVITVHIDSLYVDDTVSVVYGDDTVDPAGRAIAQTSTGTGVAFIVRSDPAGSAPADIAASPSLNVVAGTITQLVFVTSPRSFDAGGESGVMRVQTLDQYDNPSAVAADQDIGLSSTSGSGLFSHLGGGSFIPTGSVTITTGTDTVSFYYRDTIAGTHLVTATAAGEGWNDSQQVTVNPAEPVLAVSPEETSAAAGEYTRFTLTVADTFGNPNPVPAAQTITLSPDGGAFYTTADHVSVIGSIDIPMGNTTAEVDYRNDTAKSAPGYTLGFDDNDAVPPALGSAEAKIDIYHAEHDIDSSTLAVDKTTAVADSTDSISVTVTVRDAFGNPVDSIGVELVVSGTACYIDPPGAVLSDTAGEAAFDLRSTAAGAKTVRARIDGMLKANGVDVLFIAGPPDTAVSEIAAVPLTATADSSEYVTATVTVFDAHRNPVSGAYVTLVVSGTKNYINPAGITTGSGGTAPFTIKSTKAEDKYVLAVINSVTKPSGVWVTFEPGPPDLAKSTVTADPAPAVADGSDSIPVTVAVRDFYNNPVEGSVVLLQVTPSSGVDVDPDTGITETDGSAVFAVRSTVSGQKTVQAEIDTQLKPGDETVTFVAGEVDAIIITHDGEATVGEADIVTIDLRDANGNRVDWFDDTITVYTNTSVTEGNIVWGLGAGARGTIQIVSGDTVLYDFDPLDGGDVDLTIEACKAESLTIYAEYGAVSGQSATPLVVSPGTADAVSVVSGDGQTAVVETAVPLPLVVRVVDGCGNAVSDETVTFTVEAGGGTVDTDTLTPGNQAQAQTNASGEAACPTWILGTASGVGNNTVRASIAAGSSPDVLFTASATHAALDTVTIDPPFANVTVNGALGVTAVLEDSFGNPVPGENLYIYIKDAADGFLANFPGHDTDPVSPSMRRGTSDADGKVYVYYNAPEEAGKQDTVRALHASLPDTQISSGIYTSSAAGGATELRAVVLSGSTSQAGETFSFRIDAVDSYGNVDPTNASHITLQPDSGAHFTFSLTSDFAATITEADLAAGTDTIYGRGEKVGLWQIGVTAVPPPTLTGTVFPINLIAQDVVDHYAITTPEGDVAAGSNFTLSVEALDTFDNRVTEADYEILFRAVQAADSTSAASDNLSIASGVLVDGYYSNPAVRYNTAEPIRIEVNDTVRSILAYSDTINVVSAAAYRIVRYLTPADTSGVAAGDSVLLRVQVLDPFDNPVSDYPVKFTRLEGDGSPADDTLNTDGSGVAGLWFTTGTTVGLNRVRAWILNGDPAGLETQEFSINTVPRTDIDHVELVLSGDKSYVAGEEFTVEIRAYDSYGNLITTDSTTQLIPLADSASVAFFPDIVTLDHGYAIVTAADTVKGTNRIAVALADAPSDPLEQWSEWYTVDNAAAYTILKISGDETPIVAGGDTVLVAAVEDRYGNRVDGEFVVFQITSDLGGDPSLSNDGFVFTGGDGTAACTLTTDANAGINTVKATIQAGDWVIFSVETVAGNIYSYSVTPDGFAYKAGESFGITIVGYDEHGNQAFDDYSTVVRLSSNTGSTVFPDSLVTLQGGSVRIDSVIETKAGGLTITAQTEGGGPSATSGVITISPEVPGGTIQFQSVNPPTVTANGIRKSLVTTKPVTDEYGNVVETGSLITVTTSIGEVASEDADLGIPDVQRTTGPAGVVTASVLSETADTAKVHFESVEGTASGDTFVVFAPMPSIVYDGYISPGVIVPDDIVQFRCGVRNESTTGVTLYGSQSSISFGDSPNRYVAQLGNNDTIPGGATDTLVFSPAAVPSGIPGGSYTPFISITGKDEYNASYATSFNTAANAVTVSLIEITDITVQPKIVSRGDLFEVRVKVRNKGGSSVYVNNIDVSMSNGIDFVQPSDWNPALPCELIAGAELEFSGDVQIDPGSNTGESVVSATAFAEIAGTTVSDESGPAENDTILVQYGAAISYWPGSLDPAVVTRGEQYAFSIDFQNNGDASVILDGNETKFSFTDGSETFIVSLGSTRALPGNGTVTTLTFLSAEVPGDFTSGSYPVSVQLVGTENGGQFVDAPGISDLVTVQTAPDVQFVDGTLYPKQVSKQSSVAFRLDLFNAGEATVLCNPDSTWLAFDSFRALLNADQGDTIGPDTSSLYFESTTIPEGLPPDNIPTLQLIGTANGIRFDTTQELTETVTVQDPSGLVINRVWVTALSNRMTADQAQPRLLRIAVQNGEEGDATVRFDSYDVRFFKETSNVTSQYQWSLINFTLKEDSLLFGGEPDTLDVALSDNPSNDMSTGTILIEVEIRGTDENSGAEVVANTDFGQTGILVVQSPAELAVAHVIPSVTKVTAGQGKDWTVDVAIRNEGESDVELDLESTKTFLTFSTASDFAVVFPDTLQGGGSVLEGFATDTLHFVIDSTSVQVGLCTINAEVAGIEVNSGREISVSGSADAAATVDIQQRAVLEIVDLIPSQSSVTVQQPNLWSIDMAVRNTGGSDVTIDSAGVAIPEGSGFVIEELSGAVHLGGGATETLTFTVTTTGDIPTGPRVLTGAVRGTEDNSERIIRVERADSDSVTFQNRPDPQYVSGSLTPHIGSRGTEVSIRLSIRSDDYAAASLILDEDKTKVSFSDGQRFYDAFLADLSEKELAGGDATTIQFTPTNIPADIDTGTYTVQIELAGTENGNYFAAGSMTSWPDVIRIVPLPELSITKLVTPESVTRSVQPEWPVQMLVQNSGEASLVIDFDSTKTKITFEIVGEGDVTDGYTIEYPDHLEKSGSNVLPGNDEDTLIFMITKTDSTTGIARVDGYITANDINDPLTVWSDDTKTNGGRYISIQEPGEPVILQTEASQSKVTSGQEAPWTVTLTMKNEGEAALTLVPDSTYIYYDGDSLFSVLDSLQTFEEAGEEGNTTLLEGETKHLIFTVTPTPKIPDGAVLDIKARVGMIENNREIFLAYDTDTVPSARTTVTVQKPADLRIASLRSGAHNGTFVNHGQEFPLLVEIRNSGEAAVESIRVALDSDGNSTIGNGDTVLDIDSLQGGDEAAIGTFFITADTVSGQETFVARLLSAVDANSDSSGTPDDPGIIVFSEPYDDNETMTIQEPGDLRIIAVEPSQQEVNSGQTVPWTITVSVLNDGQAPVTLADPQASDIGFYQDITKQRNYIVEPPEGFASGAPDLTLGEGEADALIYEVTQTGYATGDITIEATLKWQDENDPGLGMMQLERDSSTIVVNEPSGVQIVSTTSDAPNNNTIPNTSVVNTGQIFPVTVAVSNTGGDDLDSVTVVLKSNGGSTVSPDSVMWGIPSNEQVDFKFDVTADTDTGNEILTASITRAVSATTHEQVTPLPPDPVESVEYLIIQTPAELSCSASVTDPPGAVDGTVSTTQSFTVAASVSNSGQADIDGTGTLKLTLPVDYSLDPSIPDQELTQRFSPEQEVSWIILAPGEPKPHATIAVTIDSLPLDVNIADSAAVAAGKRTANIAIVTEGRASIEDCALEIIAPDGAMDRTLSTDQWFDVQASLTPSANAGNVWAELAVPTGFEIEGDARKNIGNGDGSQKSVLWRVTAPSSPTTGQSLEITSYGEDLNTGESITDPCAPQLPVTVVEKARLELTASISDPPEAVGGELSAGISFTVQADVTNLGEAGVDATGARLEIAYPEGYFLEGGETNPKQFYPDGEPVEWKLRAPDQPTSLDYIYVRFVEPYATDVNTGTTAVIETEEVTIGVITQAGEISMRNVSAEDTIPPYVVPRGARNVPVLKIRWTNNSGSPVALDTMRIGVVNDRGEHLDPPSKRVASVALDADGEIYTAVPGAENTVPIIIPPDRQYTLQSGETKTVYVRVDIASGAPAGEMRINVTEIGDVVYSIVNDPETGVGVSWEEGEDFMSGPLSIMSGDFAEYAHNYPNPFRAGSESTRISYFLTQDASVRIDIYDLTGAHVWSKDIAAGEPGGTGAEGGSACEVEWDGRNSKGEVVRNGVYICRIQAGSKSATFKIAVAK